MILSFLLSIPLNPLYAENTVTLQNKEVIVLFEKPLRNAANAVLKTYPAVKAELVKTLGWEVDFRPVVLLSKDRQAFRRTVGNDITVAFAVPEKYLIVIDNSRAHTKPFTLKTTLKHELCHLLLNHHIETLPRWLDEGVCQWASGGISEIITTLKDSDLARASLSGRLIHIGELKRFPRDEKSIHLAYAESRSIVEYIVREFGPEGLLNMLEGLKQGLTIEEAVLKSLSVSGYELELGWRAYLKRRHTWLTYLSNNIYVILFLFAALTVVYGFIRMLIRKRAYKDEDDDMEI